jgi:hypothetical protein
MGDELYVRVPSGLALELDEDGIEELEQVRGMDWLAQGAAVTVTVLGVGADLTTVLLAKDAVTRFVQRLASWAGHRPPSAAGSELAIRFDAKDADGRASPRSFEIKLSTTGQMTQIDMAALVSFLAAAFAGQPEVPS